MSSGQVGMDGQVRSVLHENFHCLGLGRLGGFGLDRHHFPTLGSKEVVHIIRILSYDWHHLFPDGYRLTCQSRQAVVVSPISLTKDVC
jgi:hypothetical protein